jgi:hypothetical protein
MVVVAFVQAIGVAVSRWEDQKALVKLWW